MIVFAKSKFDLRVFGVIAAIAGFFTFSIAQSTSQASPTSVTTNEISGAILARDIGDPRLTNHFYQFNGNQGDVFVNVVTKNLDGDIDIFLVDGLKPLTKITTFSDAADSETGRVIYLRKPEKILLRIQGRSPNDEPATYRIKFAGSFAPLESTAETEALASPEVADREPGRVQVNSVGTIIEPPPPVHKTQDAAIQLPAPVAIPVEIVATQDTETKRIKETVEAEIRPGNEVGGDAPIMKAEDNSDEKSTAAAEGTARAKPLVIIKEYPLPENVPGPQPEPVSEKKEPAEKGEPRISVDTIPPNTAVIEGLAPAAIGPVDPLKLVKVQLIITMKGGRIVKHQINDIFSFNVTQGILRITLNDGSISRYSLVDVEKVAIEEIDD